MEEVGEAVTGASTDRVRTCEWWKVVHAVFFNVKCRTRLMSLGQAVMASLIRRWR